MEKRVRFFFLWLRKVIVAIFELVWLLLLDVELKESAMEYTRVEKLLVAEGAMERIVLRINLRARVRNVKVEVQLE